MLWLALHLPQLPLLALTRGSDDTGKAVAIHETRRQRPVICSSNPDAAALGIHPGMTLAAARSLSTSLLAIPRDPRMETTTLQQLAAWSQQFTATVCLDSNSLLLEIGGSLKLFGGLAVLQKQISHEALQLGYPHTVGIAPTPLAALWLARAHQPQPVVDRSQLQPTLARLPLHILPCPERQLEKLQGMGCRKLGHLFRLPRAGLARRMGVDFVQLLDRALGQLPDPRTPWQPPPGFDSQILLSEPVSSIEPLFFLLQRLLLELGGFLRGHGAGATTLYLDLLHPRQPASEVMLALRKPTGDTSHLLSLWREKLENTVLSDPVEGLRLHTDKLQKLTPGTADLLDASPHGEQDLELLLERLQTRLGADNIRLLQLQADHRPELAATAHSIFSGRTPSSGNNTVTGMRPLWLLKSPQPLHSRNGLPQLNGPLQLLQGPERIETGWWDRQDTRRDYYIATNNRQQTLWIYRNRGNGNSWFLHGYFS
jgi:protein ImuB